MIKTLNGSKTNWFWECFERIGSFFKKHLTIIILIIVCGVVSYFTYTGIFMGDDTLYIDNLFRLKDGIELRNPIRFPILIIEAISYLFFGRNISSIPVLFSFIYPMIVLLVYIITYNLSNKKGISIVAAVICAGCSILYIYGGAILPDNLAALFILSSYLFFILIYKSKSKKRYIHIVLCAASIVYAYMMKEIFLASLVGFIPLAFYLKPDRKFKKIILDFLLIALAAVLIFSVYVLLLYMTGNVGARLFEMNFSKADDGMTVAQSSTLRWNEMNGIYNFFDRAAFSFRVLKKMFPSAIYLLGFSFFILIISIIKKEKRIIAFTASAFIFLIVICFMPISIKPYVTTYLNERYLVIICPLLSMATALSVTLIKNKQRFCLLILAALSTAAFFWNYSIKTKEYCWIDRMGKLINEINAAMSQGGTIRSNGNFVFDGELFSENAVARCEFYFDLEYPEKDLIFLKENEDEQLDENANMQLVENSIILMNSKPSTAIFEFAKDYARVNDYFFCMFRLAGTRINIGYFISMPDEESTINDSIILKDG